MRGFTVFLRLFFVLQILLRACVCSTVAGGITQVPQLHSPLQRLPFQCKKFYPLLIRVVFDKSFMAQYGNDADRTIRALRLQMQRVSHFFEGAACVRITVEFSTRCVSDDNYLARCSIPSQAVLRQCSNNQTCHSSSVMLRKIWSLRNKRDSMHRVTRQYANDAAILFTNYSDGTSLRGAAYLSAVCNPTLHMAWVVGQDNDAVVAHEIGHLLGAEHDKEGIMKSKIQPDEELKLSDNSRAAILNFVLRDSRSWCLHREKSKSTESGLWPIPPNQVLVSFIPFSPTSTAFMMLVEPSRRRTDGKQLHLDYHFFPKLRCDHNFRIFTYTDERNAQGSLSIPIAQRMTLFGVAFGHVRSPQETDMFLSYIREVNGTDVALYRVGFGLETNGSLPRKWSPEIIIPTRGFISDSTIHVAIAVGHIQGPASVDLVYAQASRSENGNVALSYQVGFDIGPNGRPRGGWSAVQEVPGWFGYQLWSFSISVEDVDGNGMPELIIFHAEEYIYAPRSSVVVGRNLGKDGAVRDGWTDFKLLRNLPPYTMYTAHDFRKIPACGTETVSIYAWRVQAFLRLPGIGLVPPVSFYARSEAGVVTKQFVQTATERFPREDTDDGCYECYKGSEAEECRKNIEKCEALVDEIHVSRAETEISNSDLPTTMTRIGHATRQIQQEKRKSQAAPSLFCTGFEFLMQHAQSRCSVIDRGRVIAKGLTLAFKKELEDDFPDTDKYVSSDSIFENPAGLGGAQSGSITAQVILSGKAELKNSTVEKAINAVRSRPDFRGSISSRREKTGKDMIISFLK